MTLQQLLAIELPILQAPMAGVQGSAPKQQPAACIVLRSRARVPATLRSPTSLQADPHVAL